MTFRVKWVKENINIFKDIDGAIISPEFLIEYIQLQGKWVILEIQKHVIDEIDVDINSNHSTVTIASSSSLECSGSSVIQVLNYFLYLSCDHCFNRNIIQTNIPINMYKDENLTICNPLDDNWCYKLCIKSQATINKNLLCIVFFGLLLTSMALLYFFLDTKSSEHT